MRPEKKLRLAVIMDTIRLFAFGNSTTPQRVYLRVVSVDKLHTNTMRDSGSSILLATLIVSESGEKSVVNL